MNLSPSEVQQLRASLSSPTISANAVSSFSLATNSATKGVDVSFALTDTTGVELVTLLRNVVFDAGTATVLQTWAPAEASYTWSDTDAVLLSNPQAFYWIQLQPTGVSGKTVTVGPQQVTLNPQTAIPLAATAIAASHAAAANGRVLVTVNVSGSASSYRILVQGYKGNPAAVAVAQQASSPLQFTLDATGETVTLQAIAISIGGTVATSGPSTTLTLSAAATAPATPQGVTVTQIASGNQVSFQASRDSVTNYTLLRGPRTTAFGAATMLATLTSTAGTVVYLDTGGLTGDWQYFVVANNATGQSSPSAPAFPAVIYSSAQLPPNVAGNTTNNATIDSEDAGGSAIVRIYGPGGVGTAYQRLTGFGSESRPNGTISGLAYQTLYVVLWTGAAFQAVTTYSGTLPDGYEWVGTVTTVGNSNVSGSGATATAVIDGNGHVLQINVGSGGAGYSGAQVNIAGGGGSGAAGTATLSGGAVASIAVTSGGTGYTTAPAVTIVGTPYGGSTGGGQATGAGGTRGSYYGNGN